MEHEFSIYQGEFKAGQIETRLTSQELENKLDDFNFELNRLFDPDNRNPVKTTYYKEKLIVKIESAKQKGEVKNELNNLLIEYNKRENVNINFK